MITKLVDGSTTPSQGQTPGRGTQVSHPPRGGPQGGVHRYHTLPGVDPRAGFTGTTPSQGRTLGWGTQVLHLPRGGP